MTVAMEYVFCIPSYHRAERVRTLEYLSALGYEKEDILLAVQTAEDFTAYAAKYDSLANIVYRECSNVAGNRNTCLSNVPKGKVAVFLDDDVDAVCWNDTRGGEYKLREIRQRKEFDTFLNFVFHSACTHNARLAGVYPTANVKFSIITLDEAKARVVERGVPTPMQRLDAIERIADADAGGATLRLRPFIIGISTPTYLDLIREAGQRGATALSTEFFCVEQRSKTLKEYMPKISELCGFDLMALYKKYSVSQGYMRLNRNIKEPFFRKMKNLCEEVGMRFYVSDAHFKKLCCNGSCCGLPQDWNYSKGQFCEALQIAKKNPNGLVYWADVKGDIEQLHQYEWAKSSGYNCQSSEHRAKFSGMSMADYLRWLWNNPQAGQSPYKMFEGALVPKSKDEEGNIIYKYNGAKF